MYPSVNPKSLTISAKKAQVVSTRSDCKIRVVSGSANFKTLTDQPKTNMASQFAQAVQCLVAERDRVFVERIAAEYNLPLEELKAKYLECAESAIKVPRQYKKREPKAVTVVAEKAPKAPKEPKAPAEKQCCQASTSKKDPCKFSALKGEVFCKRHLKTHGEGAAETPVSKPSAPKKTPAAPKKAPEPVHNHPLTEMGQCETCSACQTFGNPLSQEAVEYEVAAPPKPQQTVSERLAALLADSDDEDVDSSAVSEEEFEEDDE